MLLGAVRAGAGVRRGRRVASSTAWQMEPQSAARMAVEEGDAGIPGLTDWRARSPDNRRKWGAGDKRSHQEEVAEHPGPPPASTLAQCAREVLETPTVEGKARKTHAAFRELFAGGIEIGSETPPGRPARPDKPQLVHPRSVPPPGEGPLPAPAHMMHNLLHVELNAIDLGADTVVRFSELGEQGILPRGFFYDFFRVADDESRHALWCLGRLRELGYEYGDMESHDMLWEGAEKTTGDVKSRLAVIPCTQEAKGLDAGPRLVDKLNGHKDGRSAAIVRQITEEEHAHVAVGAFWLRRICGWLGEEPGEVFQEAVLSTMPDSLMGPFNHEARQKAGLDRSWYDVPKRERLQRKLSIVERQEQQSGASEELRRVKEQVVKMLRDEEERAGA